MKTPRFRQRLRSWSRRQLYSFFSSLGTLLGHRLGTVMTVLVLGIAMTLPLGLYVTLQNLQAFDLRQGDWGAITVFLEPGVSETAAMELADRISTRFEAEATAISPEEGLREFRDASGFGQALEVLQTNPLPWVLEVRPRAGQGQDLAGVVERVSADLEGLDAVDVVIVDYKWLERLAGLLALGGALVTVLGLLFSIAVLVVIANTIRLDVASRAEEIEILSVVGAGNGFIRLPFLYAGFWYGLLGAALALVLLQICLAFVRSPLERLIDAYGNTFALVTPGLSHGLAVLAVGGLLGISGAWISVGRHLRALRRDGTLGRF